MKQEVLDDGREVWVSVGEKECSVLKMSADLRDFVKLRVEEKATGVMRLADAQTESYWLIGLRSGQVVHMECVHDTIRLPMNAVNWTPNAVLTYP